MLLISPESSFLKDIFGYFTKKQEVCCINDFSMKKALLIACLGLLSFGSQAVRITIIESQSFNSGHNMDQIWLTLAQGMGHTATINPQTTLDNNNFFSSTDILIISSGVIALPANRVNTILQY